MRTSDFIKGVERYGWEVARTTKHIILTNRYFRTLRPVLISHANAKDMNRDDVENCAKDMGLRWKERDAAPFPRQGSQYFQEYVRLGFVAGAQVAA
jgi:hypothetical protein